MVLVLRPIQSVQKSSVGCSDAIASVARGTGWCDGCQVRTNQARSPLPTRKSPYVVRSRPYWWTSERSETASGPAIASI
ncbi:hypothetical protein JOF29_008544 [Kribbella aluminosa]|uniref:Uncharacterized protein n=1 Tax=Kribbella aluminosa TaxID=416017 RepID=A0ABS4V0K4_9ACTN|nr:hypothetical protein [Kribbella aluminosa]MBP2357434.1 hypothetical protein [Kribbella aluminosa]